MKSLSPKDEKELIENTRALLDQLEQNLRQAHDSGLHVDIKSAPGNGLFCQIKRVEKLVNMRISAPMWSD